jgi:hypothetical protein
MSTLSPWLINYLVHCSEHLGDDLSRSISDNDFHGRNLAILKAPDHSVNNVNMTWVVLSDGLYSIVAKISKGAIGRSVSMFDKKQQDQHLAQNRILKLQRFRPVFTRIPNIIDGKVSGMSKEERIALQIDELLAKEVIVEIPPSLPTVNDVDAVRSWESTLRGDNMPVSDTTSPW